MRSAWRITCRAPRLCNLCRPQIRHSSANSDDSSKHASPNTNGGLDVAALLSKPSWSVSSLLPENATGDTPQDITPAKLRHLLRLAALPEPQTPEEESKMLSDLASQLHFVRQMQQIDVEGVEPLQAIRDETEAGDREAEITIASVQEVLDQEEVVGKHYPRLRRRNDSSAIDEETPANWKPLEHATRTVDKYFVVDKSSSNG